MTGFWETLIFKVGISFPVNTRTRELASWHKAQVMNEMYEHKILNCRFWRRNFIKDSKLTYWYWDGAGILDPWGRACWQGWQSPWLKCSHNIMFSDHMMTISACQLLSGVGCRLESFTPGIDWVPLAATHRVIVQLYSAVYSYYNHCTDNFVHCDSLQATGAPHWMSVILSFCLHS